MVERQMLKGRVSGASRARLKVLANKKRKWNKKSVKLTERSQYIIENKGLTPKKEAKTNPL
jgi:hypothetical protein